MGRFDELIQQQLRLADQMIHTREEIQRLERDRSVCCDDEKALILQSKEKLSRMEDDFERLISDVISSFEKTPV